MNDSFSGTYSGTPTVLKKIVARKWEEVAERKPQQSEALLLEKIKQVDAPRGFVASMQRALAAGRSAVIAEAKKASPSKGAEGRREQKGKRPMPGDHDKGRGISR